MGCGQSFTSQDGGEAGSSLPSVVPQVDTERKVGTNGVETTAVSVVNNESSISAVGSTVLADNTVPATKVEEDPAPPQRADDTQDAASASEQPNEMQLKDEESAAQTAPVAADDDDATFAKPGRLVQEGDTEALPEHFFYLFNRWPVLRPGLKEFLTTLRERRNAGTHKAIYIFTANTKIEWVKFVMKAMLLYFDLPTDTFDGIRHAPGGLKEVPEKAVLFDDHPENVTGDCVAVDPYHNEVPWDVLEPLFEVLPDDGKGGKAEYIARDKAYKDLPHDKESEQTLFELAQEPTLGCEEFETPDDILLDLDETLISGGRASAYYFAINHFLKCQQE